MKTQGIIESGNFGKHIIKIIFSFLMTILASIIILANDQALAKLPVVGKLSDLLYNLWLHAPSILAVGTCIFLIFLYCEYLAKRIAKTKVAECDDKLLLYNDKLLLYKEAFIAYINLSENKNKNMLINVKTHMDTNFSDHDKIINALSQSGIIVDSKQSNDPSVNLLWESIKVDTKKLQDDFDLKMKKID